MTVRIHPRRNTVVEAGEWHGLGRIKVLSVSPVPHLKKQINSLPKNPNKKTTNPLKTTNPNQTTKNPKPDIHSLAA